MAEKICDLIPTESSNILIVGCGFSRLTEELADEGFNNITSVDISYNAINLNKEEYKETYPNL
jgi:2-polyprenyl-3-methyl-5-hydroxy-6-metoxy-1,4-benzoquinol methylase